jgi:hypothetical protein
LSLKLLKLITCTKGRDRRNLPEKAAHNVLEQADGLLLHKLVDHVAKYGAYSIEALISLTYVSKTNVI